MNRREAFKVFAAGAVSLLGLKGLMEALRAPQPGFVTGTLVAPAPPPSVMGEQAHWLQT